jgi:small-conductance mechanosensitive channel
MPGQVSRLICVGLLFIVVASAAEANSPLAATLLTKGGPAADPVPLPADLRADQVEGFVALLPDAQARALLVEQLRQRAETTHARPAMATGPSLAQRIDRHHQMFGERLALIREEMRRLPAYGAIALRNLTDQEGWPAVGRGLLVLATLIVAAAAAEALVRRLTAGARERLASSSPTFVGRLSAALLGLTLDLLALGTFVLVAYALSFAAFQRFDPMRLLITSILVVIIVVRAAKSITARVLKPIAGGVPLIPLPARPAGYLCNATIVVVGLVAFSDASQDLLLVLGVPEPVLAAFRLPLGALIIAAIVALIWRQRREIAAMIAEQRKPPAAGDTRPAASWLKLAIAQSWHLLAIGYVLMVGLIWANNIVLGSSGGAHIAALSLSALLLVPLADWLARSLFDRLARLRSADGHAPPPGPLRQTVLTSIRIALLAVAVLIPLEAFTGSIFAWLATPTGAAVSRAVVTIFVTCTLGYVVWELVKGVTERHLREDDEPIEAAPADDEGGAMKPKTRLATLLPLFRTTMLVVLVVTVTMIVLSSIGIDIGPLLAGAGVVGIAVGFGAQTLVRDIVSGVFFLIDDAFRIGEYIEIGGDIRGEVERITLRSLQLRHHRGPLLTLPFGELKSITNHVRDWVIYKQEFPVAHDTDVELVRKIIKRIGQDLLNDPEYGPKMLEPLKSQGIFKIEGSALVIRTKFKCKPREQFVLRRVVFQRVKDALAANGIPLATPRVHVALPASAAAADLVAAGAAAISVVPAPGEEKRA